MEGGDTFQSSSYHSFPLKSGRVKNTPPPLIKNQSLSLSFSLSYITLLNQDGARYAIIFFNCLESYESIAQACGRRLCLVLRALESISTLHKLAMGILLVF